MYLNERNFGKCLLLTGVITQHLTSRSIRMSAIQINDNCGTFNNIDFSLQNKKILGNSLTVTLYLQLFVSISHMVDINYDVIIPKHASTSEIYFQFLL